jgi:hypothetical protein
MMHGGLGQGIRFGLTFFLVSVTVLAVGAALVFVVPDLVADILSQTPRASSRIGPSSDAAVPAPAAACAAAAPASVAEGVAEAAGALPEDASVRPARLGPPVSAAVWLHFVDDVLDGLKAVLPESPAFRISALGGLVYVSEGVTTATVNVAPGQFRRLAEPDQVAVRLAEPILSLVTSFISKRAAAWPARSRTDLRVTAEGGRLLVGWYGADGSAVLELAPVSIPSRELSPLAAPGS